MPPAGRAVDPETGLVEIAQEDLSELCERAILAAGGDRPTATELAAATVAAQRRGVAAVGVAHLFDYLDALATGRLAGSPRPRVRRDLPAVICVDADDGIAQLAFRHALEDVLGAARRCGIAALSVHRCFTVGELGHYTSTIARHGLVALAGANSPALMSLYGAPAALTGTNPFSFALPGSPTVRLVDQAASAVAWVRIREAADRGEPIPPGWALDASGEPTTDPVAALAGALLPFGGAKGANIAVAIELLAVLSGATFSLDSPDFASGTRPPRVGLFLLAIDPVAFDPDYLQRVETHLGRLHRDFGIDVGRFTAPPPELRLPEPLLARLVAAASRP